MTESLDFPEELAALLRAPETPSPEDLEAHFEKLRCKVNVLAWVIWPPGEWAGLTGVASFNSGLAKALRIQTEEGDHNVPMVHLPAPPGHSLEAYALALHELGHHATEWSEELMVHEERAWAWARKNAKWPLPEDYIEKCLESHRLKEAREQSADEG